MIELQNLTAVIYNRKSTASDGKSTRDQERQNREWCEQVRIPLARKADGRVAVFTDEGISASRYGKKPRDEWEDLKAFLRPGHILVACEASRAARDIEEFAAYRNLCAQHKVPFAYGGRVLDLTSGEDRFAGGLDALLAERETEQIRDRVLRGKRGAALSGTPSSRAPWGYRAVPRKPGERPQWEFDTAEVPRIREAVQRIIDGESLRSVRKWLQSTGYAPATVTSLRDCLIKPSLAGKRVHQGNVIGMGTWTPILTEEQHQQVIVAARRASTTPPGPEPKYLCSGIAICDKCDSKLEYHRQKHRNITNTKPVYTCPNGCVSRLSHMLDSAVEKAVLRRLRNIDAEDYRSDNPGIVEAKKRIAELDADLARWRAKAIAEEVDAEMYAAVEKDRKRKIADLSPRTNPRQKPLLTAATWTDGTIREKRETIRALLTVRVPPMKHLGRRATEDDVNITPK